MTKNHEPTKNHETTHTTNNYWGKYELKGLLGEGGSAEVFRATDTLLARDVALKRIHPHASEAEKSRFLREIKTLAHLSHPAIVPVLDLAEAEGRPFFAMPLLQGSIIQLSVPNDTANELEHFLEVASRTAEGLQHIHSRGMIHRDLTPANILLDESSLPRIMDFGLVALSEKSHHLTRTGATLGTPAYMSPEQAKGKELDPRSDLYALGAVLYRVACGVAPFVADNDQSILYQHVYETPIDPREHNPALPCGLAELLLALLQKQPERRPPNGTAVMHLLALVRRQLWAKHIRGQFRGGLTRTGFSPDGIAFPERLTEHWSLSLGSEVTWPAAVIGYGDLLAVGTRSGQLQLTHSSGTIVGTHSAYDEVTAPPTFWEGKLIYGAWDGSLRQATIGGKEHWCYQARGEFSGAVAVWKGQVLAASRDGSLHALDYHSGEVLWTYTCAGIGTSPVVWNGIAFICDEEGWLHALEANSGTLIWKALVGTVYATPALRPLGEQKALLIVATWQGEVHALELEEGGRIAPTEPRWTYDIEDEIWACPLLTEDHVVVAGWSGMIRALRTSDGEDCWEHHMQARVTASPISSGGVVYVASEGGEVQALSLEGGLSRWNIKHPQGIQATPLLANGKLYVAYMDGTLRAYHVCDT